jgi:hypothetical protein
MGVAVDTTDQVSSNGILFADARWAPNGTTDPVADPFPTIVSLLTSNYLDIDAPNPALYPQGMLLFNTRRSGYNVKSFQSNYFNSTTFPDDTLPTVDQYLAHSIRQQRQRCYVCWPSGTTQTDCGCHEVGH